MEWKKPLILPSCTVECLGVWAWEADSFLHVGLLHLCQGSEQHLEALALNHLFVVL